MPRPLAEDGFGRPMTSTERSQRSRKKRKRRKTNEGILHFGSQALKTVDSALAKIPNATNVSSPTTRRDSNPTSAEHSHSSYGPTSAARHDSTSGNYYGRHDMTPSNQRSDNFYDAQDENRRSDNYINRPRKRSLMESGCQPYSDVAHRYSSDRHQHQPCSEVLPNYTPPPSPRRVQRPIIPLMIETDWENPTSVMSNFVTALDGLLRGSLNQTATEKINDLIDKAYDRGILTSNNRADLHSLRKARNDRQHPKLPALTVTDNCNPEQLDWFVKQFKACVTEIDPRTIIRQWKSPQRKELERNHQSLSEKHETLMGDYEELKKKYTAELNRRDDETSGHEARPQQTAVERELLELKSKYKKLKRKHELVSDALRECLDKDSTAEYESDDDSTAEDED